MSAATVARPQVARAHAGDMRVLVVRDATFPIVHFSFTFRPGALADADAKPGAVGMALPWLLRGTRRRSRADFSEALERLGSTLDTSVSHELATIHGSALREALGATLALLEEALAEPRLEAEALADLCEEARQGLVSERDDDDALAEVFLRETFFAGTPLSRSPLGTCRSLGALSPADVDGARRSLRASACTAAFAGDVTLEQAAAAAARVGAALSPGPPAAHARPLPPEHRGRAPQVLLVDKPDRSQAQIRLALPGIDAREAALDPFWLGVVAFGGTFTSPLTREIRDKRGWSYVAHADFRRRSLLPSPVVLRTAPAIADAVDCAALQLDMVAALQDGQLEPASLVRARDYLLGRAPFWTATAFDVLGPAVALDLLGLPESHLWDTEARLEAVDLATVPALMARVLANRAPVVVVVGSRDRLEKPLQDKFDARPLVVRPHTDGIDPQG